MIFLLDLSFGYSRVHIVSKISRKPLLFYEHL
jgi:hypothetical protein